VSRRDQIVMSGEEAAAFLAAGRVVTCATNGRDGWPHLMPLWYVVRAGELWSYGGADLTPELEAAMRAQAAKRVGLQFVERRRVTWDHRKLGGKY
jgi:nitroimidazol reductase NimA-like FMN-containing flavoprotein (pyridoxamine 5'-phosphate oxidase superfamily)